MTLIEWAKSRNITDPRSHTCPNECIGCIMYKLTDDYWTCQVPGRGSSITLYTAIREYAIKVLNKVKIIDKWKLKR
jgi:hypothetical protein